MSHHDAKALQAAAFVRLPKVSSPALLKVSDLFILIYSFMFPDVFLKFSLRSSHSNISAILAGGGMFGGASLKAKRYSALKSTTKEINLNFFFLSFEGKRKKQKKFSKSKNIALYLLALSQELLCCFSEKEVTSVTPMYR